MGDVHSSQGDTIHDNIVHGSSWVDGCRTCTYDAGIVLIAGAEFGTEIRTWKPLKGIHKSA